jgi:hypothetical protein
MAIIPKPIEDIEGWFLETAASSTSYDFFGFLEATAYQDRYN